jgi:starch synthase
MTFFYPIKRPTGLSLHAFSMVCNTPQTIKASPNDRLCAINQLLSFSQLPTNLDPELRLFLTHLCSLLKRDPSIQEIETELLCDPRCRPLLLSIKENLETESSLQAVRKKQDELRASPPQLRWLAWSSLGQLRPGIYDRIYGCLYELEKDRQDAEFQGSPRYGELRAHKLLKSGSLDPLLTAIDRALPSEEPSWEKSCLSQALQLKLLPDDATTEIRIERLRALSRLLSSHVPDQRNQLMREANALKRSDPKLFADLCRLVYYACYKPDVPGFGEQRLLNDPAILGRIKNRDKQSLIDQLLSYFQNTASLKRMIRDASCLLEHAHKNSPLATAYLDYLFAQDSLLKDALCTRAKELDAAVDVRRLTPADLLSFHGENLLQHAIDQASKHTAGSFEQLSDACAKAADVPSSPVASTQIEKWRRRLENLTERPDLWIHVSAELADAFKVGGLGEAVLGLALAAKQRGSEPLIILPRYTALASAVRNSLYRDRMLEAPPGSGRWHQIWKGSVRGVSCYFVEGDFSDAYGPGEERRFAQFSSVAAELALQLATPRSIVHVHDWSSALVPELFARRHPDLWRAGQTPATIFTFHNTESQGRYSHDNPEHAQILRDIGIFDKTNINCFVLGGLHASDAVTTVSKQFAEESQWLLGHGLEWEIRKAANPNGHKGSVTGIVNGSFPEHWSTASNTALRNWQDPYTKEKVDLTFSSTDPDLLDKKNRNAEQLQKWWSKHRPWERMNFPGRQTVLYLGRYADQKGLELLSSAMRAAVHAGAQFVCLGVAGDDASYHIIKRLEQEAKELGGYAAVIIDERVEGRLQWQDGTKERLGMGALLRTVTDILVAPSKFEPCGLVQMEAWLMGAPSVVASRTGGFIDTVPPEGGRLFDINLSHFNSKEQHERIAAAVKEELLLLRGLTPEELCARIQKNTERATKMGWTDSPDPDELPPIDRYFLVADDALHEKKLSRGELRLDFLLPTRSEQA